ncbi:MAG: glycerol kinase [Robiginitomaculum sp.]|nr:MAG: glycerol kinase [Robiginitomaculum sp.]
MSDKRAILAIDQGTTSSRAIVFSLEGEIVAQAQREFAQIYPQPGWVEHDPEEIWDSTCAVIAEALDEARESGWQVLTAGITNQRETTIIWDRVTGMPIYNAIVWQDRRTAARCAELAAEGHEEMVSKRTGLLLDPYFSASKISWILDEIPGARARAEAGELAFGTVESFLLWRLSGGVHLSDATNASRTSLYDIHTGKWDEELLALFEVPAALLPTVCPNAGKFALIAQGLPGGGLPITGMAGDQQAAAIGQACYRPGEMKITFGTGAFMLANTGDKAVQSKHRLLTTIAWEIEGVRSYAMEGSILSAGSTLQWLRDGLGIIEHAGDSEEMASSITDTGGVYMVPAFAGLGAPWWDAEARGALVGLTRGTGPEQIARAGLEAVAYQCADLLDAMKADGIVPKRLKVDGGMTKNAWLMQFLADMVALPVLRPKITETTAFGVAMLAGIGAGIFESLIDVDARWHEDASFTPAIDATARQAKLAGWNEALGRVKTR